MYVKMNIGLYKGEIRDIEEESARGLLARGDASEVSYEVEQQSPEIEVPESPIEAKLTQQSRRKR